MKLLFVIIICFLFSSAQAEVIYQADTNNYATKHTLFTVKDKLCTLAFRFDYSSVAANLSLVNFKDCEFTEARYSQSLKQVLGKLKEVLPKVRITHFSAGEGQPHPLTFKALETIAQTSIKDPDFKRIQKEGERYITLNSVFQKLVAKTKAFDHFVELHKSAGLPLAYERSEKILRDKNAKGERIISGAGLIFFKVQ